VGLIRVLAALLFAILLPAQQAELRIVQAALHEYEDGPSIPKGYRFNSGDQIFLSLRVAGFKATPGEDKRVSLTYTAQAEDERGRLLESAVSGKVAASLAAEDKEWMPKIRYSFGVPPLADPGTYRIRIAVRDELAGTQAAAEIPFTVRGRTVEPSDTLVIRNFRFLRDAEQDGPALNPPVYRPGEPVGGRFEITGYQYGEKNAFSVEYGIEVLKANGERILEEPKAASEQNATFYPKRYVEGSLQLGFKPELPKGEYAVVITTRDLVGNQVRQERFTFQIE
jgi:hypothetical protein